MIEYLVEMYEACFPFGIYGAVASAFLAGGSSWFCISQGWWG